jgi:hypothetical protein
MYFNILFVLILIPTITWAANRYGAAGAGWVWLGMNLLPLLIWLPVVHQKFAPGLNMKWYFCDVLPIIGTMALCAHFLNQIIPAVQGRIQQVLLCFFFGSTLLITGILSSSAFRKRIKEFIVFKVV